ncbi:hypothetical protein U9M48_009068 [Paspalum notatum var. saurae]|uniref:Uncharacterized protein n=1 Tax=Paspalum notatum var. saurae TaxID=547442 RepID=A0AAQ3WEF3_PASNO
MLPPPSSTTSMMHRPRLSSRSNAAFRSCSSGSTAASGRAADAERSECCLVADQRLARHHRIRSTTHQMRGMEEDVGGYLYFFPMVFFQ